MFPIRRKRLSGLNSKSGFLCFDPAASRKIGLCSVFHTGHFNGVRFQFNPCGLDGIPDDNLFRGILQALYIQGIVDRIAHLIFFLVGYFADGQLCQPVSQADGVFRFLFSGIISASRCHIGHGLICQGF